MALINIEPTATVAQKAAKRIRSASARLHALMLNSHQEIYQALWETPTSPPAEPNDPPTYINAQDILNELGTDAAALFVAGGKAVEILLGQNAAALTEAQYLPKRAPTINVNGTVTLAP